MVMAVVCNPHRSDWLPTNSCTWLPKPTACSSLDHCASTVLGATTSARLCGGALRVVHGASTHGVPHELAVVQTSQKRGALHCLGIGMIEHHDTQQVLCANTIPCQVPCRPVWECGHDETQRRTPLTTTYCEDAAALEAVEAT